jgi:glycosyltransferase involved in cell wall biosynthesis
LKIALVRKEFNALHGGAERYAVNLANGLAELGHDVHVFCGKSNMKEKSNITVHPVSYLQTPSPVKNLSFSRNSAKLIAKESFDIVNGLAQIFPQDIYRVGDPLHINWLKTFSSNPVKKVMKYLNPRHLALLYIEKNIFKQGNYKRTFLDTSFLYKCYRLYFLKSYLGRVKRKELKKPGILLCSLLNENLKNQKENLIRIMKRYISKEFKNLNIQVLSISIS